MVKDAGKAQIESDELHRCQLRRWCRRALFFVNNRVRSCIAASPVGQTAPWPLVVARRDWPLRSSPGNNRRSRAWRSRRSGISPRHGFAAIPVIGLLFRQRLRQGVTMGAQASFNPLPSVVCVETICLTRASLPRNSRCRRPSQLGACPTPVRTKST